MVRYPLLVAVVAVMASVTALPAQTRRASMLPAETPPADFEPGQYVDSRGCVFVRAGSNGAVTWLPLLGPDRQPQCGFRPSLGGVPFQPGPPDVAAAADPAPPAAGAEDADASRDASADAAAPDPRPEAEPVVIAAPDTPRRVAAPAEPRAMLRVIERRGHVIEVPPDPNARSVLRVIEQRGLLFYPDA